MAVEITAGFKRELLDDITKLLSENEAPFETVVVIFNGKVVEVINVEGGLAGGMLTIQMNVGTSGSHAICNLSWVM